MALGQFATQYVALSNDLGRTSAYLATSPHLDTLNKVIQLTIRPAYNKTDGNSPALQGSFSSSLPSTSPKPVPLA
jgi:hypothetical protein